jgi:hypothetical protein
MRGFFLVWCFVLFAGGFGEIGVSTWCFNGLDVVDWVGKMVCGRTVFGVGIFCRFLGFIFGGVGEEQATAKTKYRDPSTRRFAPSLRMTTKN